MRYVWIVLFLTACGKPNFYGAESDCKQAFSAIEAKAAAIQENVTTTDQMIQVMGTPWLTADSIQYKYQVSANGYCGMYVVYSSDKVVKMVEYRVYERFNPDGSIKPL